jgi:hypothetical protein
VVLVVVEVVPTIDGVEVGSTTTAREVDASGGVTEVEVAATPSAAAGEGESVRKRAAPTRAMPRPRMSTTRRKRAARSGGGVVGGRCVTGP